MDADWKWILAGKFLGLVCLILFTTMIGVTENTLPHTDCCTDDDVCWESVNVVNRLYFSGLGARTGYVWSTLMLVLAVGLRQLESSMIGPGSVFFVAFLGVGGLFMTISTVFAMATANTDNTICPGPSAPVELAAVVLLLAVFVFTLFFAYLPKQWHPVYFTNRGYVGDMAELGHDLDEGGGGD